MFIFKRSILSVTLSLLVMSVLPLTRGEVALVVELQSLDALFNDVETASAGMKIADGRATLEKSLLQMLHLQDFSALDTAKPVRMYLSQPEQQPGTTAGPNQPPVVVAVPVRGDGADYLEAIGGRFAGHESAGNMHHFSGPAAPGTTVPDLYVNIDNGNAFMGLQEAEVAAIAELAAAGKADAYLGKLPGTVRIGLNMKACSKFVEKGADEAARAAGQAPQQTMPGIKLDPGKMLKAEGDAFVAVISQIESLTLGLSGRENTIDLYGRISPLTGTALEKILKMDREVSTRYMKTVPADALLAVVDGGMHAFDVYADAYMDLMEGIYRGMGPEMEKMSADLRAMMSKVKGLYAGDLSFVVVPRRDGKGVGFMEFVAVKDVAGTKAVMDDMLSVAGGMYTNLLPGFELREEGKRTHRGIEIKTYAYAVEEAGSTNAPSVPNPMMMGMRWLKNMKFEIAYVGNNMIYTFGGPEMMDRAIGILKDGAGKGLAGTEPFATLVPALKQPPVNAFGLSLLKMAKVALGAMKDADPNLLASIPGGTGGIAGYSLMLDGDQIGVMRISYSEIDGIKTAGARIGQLFTQMMMKGMLEGAMTATPDMIRLQCINQLRMIDAAKEQYAMEHNLSDGAVADPAGISEYLRGGRLPTCPQGGEYTIKPIGTDPTCSIPGHALR